MLGDMRSSMAFLALVLLGLSARSGEPAREAGTFADPRALAEFENRVRPLLAARCVKCHGPEKQESNLRLDSRAAMMQGGDSGPAIVPGKAEESLLVKAIRHQGDIQMPPDSRLKDDQVTTLTRWVAQGAPWPEQAGGAAIRQGGITPEDRAFWSFQPVRPRPAPAVKDRDWVRSPVDRWILAGLAAKGLHPVQPADRRTLIRRATFDLTGLPPTPEDVDAFLADASPDAFARVVERLLASPAYGERWGRHWLDVVRYADTAGETADYPVREAYKYRDYVISAFNQDMPYDQFVREQVAGDIMAGEDPGPSYARLVTATGFIAVSRRFGFDSENYHHLTIQDTIDTLGQAILGLTLGCARCHDHKYDPVSARDYYALYGIFDSTRYPFPGSEQKPKMRSMASLRPSAESESLRESIARAKATLKADKVALPGITIETLDELDGDFEIQKPSAGGSLGCLVNPWCFEGRPDVIAQAQSPFTNLTHIAGTVGVRFPGDASDHRVWQRFAPTKTRGRLHFNVDFRNPSPQAGGPGTYRLFLGHGPGRSPAVEVFVGANAVLVRKGDSTESIRPLRPGTWYNLRLILDTERKTYSGTVAAPGDVTTFSDRPFSPGWDGTIDTILLDGRGPVPGVRPALDVDNLALRETPIPTLDAPSVDEPAGKAGRDDHARRLAALIDRRAGDLAYGVAEGTPHDVRIQKRGEPSKPGEVVPRRFLEVLGGDSLADGAEGSGRLQLADWLTRPGNPMTARVMVNRIWEGHFGNGLVATENDFGRRGRRPTHPGLLDDLAHRFMAGGWSIKAMHRLIMLSSTYQLSSEYDGRSAELDPADELLWRFPPRRLDAESIRDAILMLGGGLDRSPAGPHPFPPTGTTFTQHGPFYAVYPSNRRSVYLMTQRNRRHPFLSLFDGPDPNASTAKRSITTVPTQALFFMNDPFVHEQAQGFARRLLAATHDEGDRIRLAYRMAMAREPLDEELARSKDFLSRYRRQLGADGVPVGEQSRLSWSAFARTLFARNEFVFID
ncbi:MAG: PSD1 and planctomycete cytochrome C domain-containing protein [Isosphaeraceae bacterium]